MRVDETLQKIIHFLNFPADAPLEDMREFLQQAGLCRYELILPEDGHKSYSLYSRQEILARLEAGLPMDHWLARAAAPVDESGTYTRLTDPALARAGVAFPEDDGTADGGAARLRRAFQDVRVWFQEFMSGCAAGEMNVETLNAHGPRRNLLLEFRAARDRLNPVLTPVGLSGLSGPADLAEEACDSDVKGRLLALWVYPLIFSGNGRELARVRRCRQCGTHFPGRRVSASFCTAKCRMAHHYAHRS